MKKLTALLAAALLGAAVAQTTLTIAVYPDLDSHLDVVLPIFHEENPDIIVEMVRREHGDHHNGLVTELAASTGAADVVALDVEFVARFLASGALVDLAQEPYNAGQYQDLYAPYSWSQISTADGRTIALPGDLGPGVLFLRRDILEQVGTTADEVTASWDAYLDYGRAVVEQTDAYLLTNAADVARAYFQSNVPEGEGFFFDADGNVTVTSDRFVRAFEIAQTIREEGLDAQIGDWSNEWYEAFNSGTTASQFSGAWLLGHLQNWMAPDTSGLWITSNFPEDTFGSWGGTHYAIPEQSQNKEAAWKLVQFLSTRPEIQLSAFHTTAAFPAVTSTYEDESFDEAIEFLGGQDARNLFAQVAQNTPGVAVTEYDHIALEIVQSALTEVLNNGRDIDAALEDAAAQIQRRAR